MKALLKYIISETPIQVPSENGAVCPSVVEVDQALISTDSVYHSKFDF